MIIGAPYTVSESMIDGCKVYSLLTTIIIITKYDYSQCDVVAHGNTPILEDVDGNDPYEVRSDSIHDDCSDSTV